MPHVPDGWRDCLVLILHEIVDLFVGWIGAWDQVILVQVGIVRTG